MEYQDLKYELQKAAEYDLVRGMFDLFLKEHLNAEIHHNGLSCKVVSRHEDYKQKETLYETYSYADAMKWCLNQVMLKYQNDIDLDKIYGKFDPRFKSG